MPILQSTSNLTLLIDSDPAINHIELLSECMRKLCSLTPLDQKAIEDINLSLVEGVNNVIEHSYAYRPGEAVQVNVSLQPDRVIIDIVDTGAGLENGVLPQIQLNTFDPQDTQNLPEGGWGLFIMSNGMDELQYSRVDGTNTLTLCKLF
ncbi:MAG: ATP-binding protein [Pseudomonadota bacterium]